MECQSLCRKVNPFLRSTDFERLSIVIKLPQPELGSVSGVGSTASNGLGTGQGPAREGDITRIWEKKTRECRLRQRPGECRLRRVSNQLRRVKAAFTAWNIAVVPLSVGGYPTFVGYVQPTSQRPTPSTAWWPPRASTVIFPFPALAFPWDASVGGLAICLSCDVSSSQNSYGDMSFWRS